MSFQFTPAVKADAKLRLSLQGPSGSGKTYSALRIAAALVAKIGGKIAVIDTEHKSASKYADEFTFDTLQLDDFDPRNYIGAIGAAVAAGYAVIIIDSLSHAWIGSGGALEKVDQAAATMKGNSYMAWGKVTPLWNELLGSILRADAHVIATMRSKSEYVVENINGRNTPKKIGMAAQIREGAEYEFDVVGELSLDHTLVITKTRCRSLDEKSFDRPGADVAHALLDWLQGAEPEAVEEIERKGAELYGAEWSAKRAELSLAISKNATPTPANLTDEERAKFISGLDTKLAVKNHPVSTEQPPPPEPAGESRPRTALATATELLRVANAAGVASMTDKATDADTKKLGIAFTNLGREFDRDARHKIIDYVFGRKSSKDMNRGEVFAVVTWIDATKDETGTWVPNLDSVDEARAIIAAHDASIGDVIGDKLDAMGQPIGDATEEVAS